MMREPERTHHSAIGSAVPVLDAETFDELRDTLASQPESLVCVYRAFLSNAVVFFRVLREQEGDARADTLHTLKGSAAMVGAKRVAALAGCLQQTFPPSPSLAEQAISELEAELADLRHTLAAQLETSGYPITL